MHRTSFSAYYLTFLLGYRFFLGQHRCAGRSLVCSLLLLIRLVERAVSLDGHGYSFWYIVHQLLCKTSSLVLIGGHIHFSLRRDLLLPPPSFTRDGAFLNGEREKVYHFRPEAHRFSVRGRIQGQI